VGYKIGGFVQPEKALFVWLSGKFTSKLSVSNNDRVIKSNNYKWIYITKVANGFYLTDGFM